MTRLVEFYAGWKKNPKEFRKHIRQGGITGSIWKTQTIQNYIGKEGKHTFGYIGSFDRTVSSDKLVVKILKSKGWTDRQIAQWMISSEGRHIADNIGSDYFEKNLKNLH